MFVALQHHLQALHPYWLIQYHYYAAREDSAGRIVGHSTEQDVGLIEDKLYAVSFGYSWRM